MEMIYTSVKIFIYLSVCILGWNILTVLVHRSERGSFPKMLGESIFAVLISLYRYAENGLSRIYSHLSERGLNNVLGIMGAAVCAAAFIILSTSDISFVSLMGAQFWKIDPDKLKEGIIKAYTAVAGQGSILGIFESFAGWAEKHVSTEVTPHFLAANAIITLVALMICGLFLKEVLKPGWLPLNLKKKGRIFVGIISILFVLALGYYYGFLVYYGVASQDKVEAAKADADQVNLFSDVRQEDNSIIKANGELQAVQTEKDGGLKNAKYAACISYAVAVLGANFLAFWGLLIFFGLLMTISVIVFRLITLVIYSSVIQPLGIALEYMSLQAEGAGVSSNNAITSKDESDSANPASDRLPDLAEANNSPNTDYNNGAQVINGSDQTVKDKEMEAKTEDEGNVQNANTDFSSLQNSRKSPDPELEYLREENKELRLAEEERKNRLNNNPLNLE